MWKNPTVDSVVGTYELDSVRLVYLENGIVETYLNGKKVVDRAATAEKKWKIVEGEVHVDFGSWIKIHRFNKDGGYTSIGKIVDGKRKDWSKKDQSTYKKIK